MLLAETDPKVQEDMFRKSHDATLDKAQKPLPGLDVHHASGSIRLDHGSEPRPVRIGYRAFDRQWILPDSRLMDRARPDLWAARVPGQVFVIEQHVHEISDGPGIVVSALVPDFDYFNAQNDDGNCDLWGGGRLFVRRSNWGGSKRGRPWRASPTSERSEARLATPKSTEKGAQSIEKIESPTKRALYRTSTFRNCHGSLSSMSSGKRPGRFSSGVQSV